MPEVETLRLRSDLIGKPHDYVREEMSRDRPLQAGDLVRSRRRRAPGRTVYWLKAVQSNGEDCSMQTLSLPAGGPDINRRHVPGKVERLELVTLAQTPSWLILRARNMPAGLTAWASSGDTDKKLGEKPAPVVEENPIERMDRMSLRVACMDTGLDRPKTMRMTPTEMRTHLRTREYVPPAATVRVRSRQVATTAREEVRVRAENLHPVVLDMLPTEDLLKLTRGGELGPELRTIQEISVMLRTAEAEASEQRRQADHATSQLEARSQALAAAQRDNEAARSQLADARTELVEMETRLRVAEAATATQSQGSIPKTEKNEEALRVGREVLRQRGAAGSGGRFGMIKRKPG
jgi:hypothetical protein